MHTTQTSKCEVILLKQMKILYDDIYVHVSRKLILTLILVVVLDVKKSHYHLKKSSL